MLEATIEQAIKMKYHVSPEWIRPLGGGFYGRAFQVFLPIAPWTVVAKLHLFPHFAVREANQLTKLAEHGSLKVPQVYAVFEAGASGLAYDVLIMEYLEGINAGEVDVSRLSEQTRNRIGNQIVDNILAVHETIHQEGFGELDAQTYAPSWQEYYRPKAQRIYQKAEALFARREINEYVLAVMKEAVGQFDRIFRYPIEAACLIHGDYNTWNVMLNKEMTEAAAFLDPFGCCWADSELDLYQLDNANGRAFGLLEKYRQKKRLSRNYPEKRCFYELFTEINHYYDSHVRVDLEPVKRLAAELEQALRTLEG